MKKTWFLGRGIFGSGRLDPHLNSPQTESLAWVPVPIGLSLGGSPTTFDIPLVFHDALVHERVSRKKL